jgi:hypothetical protein
MSRYDDILGNKGNGPKPVGKKVYLDLTCQVCYKEVLEQEYFPQEGILRYKCEDGHPSFMEDFWVPI